MNLTKRKISNLSTFDMIIAHLILEVTFFKLHCKKLVLNVLLMFLIKVYFGAGGIKVVSSFLLAPLLVVTMFDFQI